MDPTDRDEPIVQLIADVQGSLYGFILHLLPNSESARDVLAESNLVMWRKRDQFELGTDFWAWAARIALFEVKNYRRRCQRDPHHFDDALVQQLATDSLDDMGYNQQTLDALEHCEDKLSPQDRDLLQRRYRNGKTVRAIGADVNRSPQAVSQALYRIRSTLLRCIQRTLASQEIS